MPDLSHLERPGYLNEKADRAACIEQHVEEKLKVIEAEVTALAPRIEQACAEFTVPTAREMFRVINAGRTSPLTESEDPVGWMYQLHFARTYIKEYAESRVYEPHFAELDALIQAADKRHLRDTLGDMRYQLRKRSGDLLTAGVDLEKLDQILFS